MTVLCVNSTVVYADIAAADAAEGSINYGVPTRFEQTGTSTTSVFFVDTDYVSSFIYTATSGEETTGVITVGAQMTAQITTSVDDGVIENLRVNTVSSSAAVDHLNKNLIASGSGQDLFIFSSNAGIDENCIAHDCSEGWRSGSTRDAHIAINCTAIDCTGFGFLRPRTTDTVALNTSSATYQQEGGSSSNYWADDGNGSNAITEGTPTDIFEDYAGGDYRIKAASSVGVAGAGAFINSASGITGTVTQTAASFTQALVGTNILNITGTITQDLSAFTQSATGTVTSLGITGSITQTAASFTQAATGIVTATGIVGSISQTTASFTQSLTGTVTTNITGTITQTTSAFTQSANGLVIQDITGTITQTVSSFTQSATGTVPLNIPTSGGLLGNGSTGNGITATARLGAGITGRGSL